MNTTIFTVKVVIAKIIDELKETRAIEKMDQLSTTT